VADDPGTIIRVMEVGQANPVELAAFLEKAFGPDKGRFLSNHGDWWHRGSGNRYVATCDGTIAGYRGIIPTVCLVEGKELPAVWGVDLYVLPRFRGLGLQKLLDQRLLEASDLVMSFPGELGAKIYAKQGYGVRQDLEVLRVSLAPKPLAMAAPGTSGLVRHVVARCREMGIRESARRALARGRAAGVHTQTTHYRPRRTETIDSPDLEVLEDLFLRYHSPDVATTLRSAEFLRWRYLAAPYSSDLTFYLSDSHGRATHCAIVRYLRSEIREARVLDVFGDLDDDDGLTDLLRTVLRDATHREVEHVTILGSSPQLMRTLHRAGFEALYRKRFRWLSNDPAIQERFFTIQLQWSLGDSDADRPQ
jgi:GNAT superfamily N-acetyltransferase